MSIEIYSPPTHRKDYRIEIKVRNNWLLRKIEEQGYDSVNAFCKSHGLTATYVGKYAALKEVPVNSENKWKRGFVKIANALKCMPEDICPPQHLKEILKKNKVVIEAGIEDISGYLSGNEDTATPAIDHVLQEEEANIISRSLELLTPREERALRLRYGLNHSGKEYTLEEAGNMMNVTRERMRQIEAKAFRKLRHPSFSNKDPKKEALKKDLREAAIRIGAWTPIPKEMPDRHYVPEWKKIEAKLDEADLLEKLKVIAEQLKRL